MTAKRIIFFDGDGTLWYPRATKYMEAPHWVYKEERSLDGYCEQLMLIPSVLATLRTLKKRGIITVLLSTHPHDPEEAAGVIQHKVRHFDIHELFDEVHATRLAHPSKGEYIVKILRERGIAKCRALMVGDNYCFDYQSAKNVGVEAVLIESDYRKRHAEGRRVRRMIRKLSDVLAYI